MRSAIQRHPRPVSVVVPTLNGGARYLRLLDALAHQDLPGGFELVVVDSGSTDGTWEASIDAGAYVERIPPREFQHGRTRNRAIARASGEVVCLLTQDAVPLDEHYLASLVAPYADPAVDGVYARQLPRPDCDPILGERLARWSASRTEQERSTLAAGDPAASRARFEELPPLERYLACAFDNVASSVRRSTWERHPFPERRFGEDVAWARQVLLAGGTVVFEPTARVEHSHRIELAREFKRLYCDHDNLRELFGLRNVPSWGDVWRGWHYQRRAYADLLRGAPLSRAERLYWRAYSVPYALAETAAQFLGGRSAWKVRESALWAWVDRRVRRGV